MKAVPLREVTVLGLSAMVHPEVAHLVKVRVRPRGQTETVDLLPADARDQVRLGGTALEIVTP